MTKQSIEIKRLLHECNIDMGTFGLIELQLLELERQAQIKHPNGGQSVSQPKQKDTMPKIEQKENDMPDEPFDYPFEDDEDEDDEDDEDDYYAI